MSREIKFRAWSKVAKKMANVSMMGMGMYLLETEDGHSGSSDLEDIEIMQYTGLKDKNGKEIYEGDILDDGGVIEFRDDLNWDSGGSVHSGFFSTSGYEYEESGCLSYHYQIGEYEVVGNIYENPGLVK